MFMANREVYEKGKSKFVNQLKAQLKENRNLEVDITSQGTVYDGEKGEISFTAHIHTVYILSLSHEMVEEFGVEAKGIELIECQKILNKKEGELVKKFTYLKLFGFLPKDILLPPEKEPEVVVPEKHYLRPADGGCAQQ